MIGIIIPVALALLAIYVLKQWISGKDAASESKSVIEIPPGPRPYPFIGSSHLINSKESPFVSLSALSEQYGDIYSIKIGSTQCAVVSSVATIKNVLMQNGKLFGGRPDFIRYHKLFDGDRQNSLALCDWSNLQVKRRNIARIHCFPKQQSIKEAMTGVATLEMGELVSTLRIKSAEAAVQGIDLNIKPILLRTTLNMFTHYMCSLRFDPENDEEFKNIAAQFDEIFWEINQGYAVDFFPWLSPFYDNHLKKLTNWSQIIRSFILSRIINMRELNLDDEEEPKDFTDALLKALKNETILTKEAILFTLEDFLGGNAAVSNLAMIMLGLVAKHPEVGIRIQQEIDEVTGRQRAINMVDADQMPYTMAVIKETLRYTSSPIVPHVATEAATVSGYTIEKGTLVLINNYKINMSEKYWDNPKQFQPERFLNKAYVEFKNERRGSEHDSGVESENESNDKFNKKTSDTTESIETKTTKREILSLKTNLSHFIPFSTGKRTCLGQGLAVNYGLVILGTILQNFNVSCKNPESIKIFTACVALPPDTYGLTLTPRT